MMIKNNKPVFITFFPECNNIHLVKDVGMIPYIMHRDHGYESHIVCYQNGQYSYLENEVKGLKLTFMKKNRFHSIGNIFNKFIHIIGFIGNWISDKINVLLIAIDALPILLKYRKENVVFQLYHIKYESIIIGMLYRIINKNAVIYLKLDMDPGIIEYYKKNPKKLKNTLHLSYFLFKKVFFNIVSVESKELYDFMRKEHPVFKKCNIQYIPNGIDVRKLTPSLKKFEDKDNFILHIARMGTHQKASEIVLESFTQVSRTYHLWKLILIGSMEDGFNKYYRDMIEKYPHIKDKVIHIDFIEDREIFFKYYSEAKIFVLPSRYESFGIVAIEAGFFGNVLLATDIPSIRDITNNGRYGYLCNIDNIPCFIKQLTYMMSNDNELRQKSTEISEYILNKYDINTICVNLNVIIQKEYNHKLFN